MLKDTIKGKTFVLGDNIDTDQIIPAQHLVYKLDDEEERKKYGEFALSSVPDGQSGLPDGNIRFMKEGEWQSEYTFIVAGKNFGCGSSREHAPFALNIAGIHAIIAESYARIFFRNSVNGGYLAPFETETRLMDIIKTGDELELDTPSSTLRNLTTGETYKLRSLGDVEEILKAGDVFAYAKAEGMIAS